MSNNTLEKLNNWWIIEISWTNGKFELIQIFFISCYGIISNNLLFTYREKNGTASESQKVLEDEIDRRSISSDSDFLWRIEIILVQIKLPSFFYEKCINISGRDTTA